MSLTFNEFQRELQKRNIEPNTAYILTLIYERMGEIMKGQEDNAKATLALAGNMQGFVALSEGLNQRMNTLARGVFQDGVEVGSVANDPEKDKH